MKKRFVIILLLLTEFSYAQEVKIYPWSVAKSALPDTIYGISFQKMKLDSLPTDLQRFKNVKVLELNNNKLKTLPSWFSSFSYLESLNISKNKFDSLPGVLYQLTGLKKLSFAQNTVSQLGDNISLLKSLEFLDFWDNPIANFPQSLMDLENLKIVHAEGIKYGPKFQKKWIESMPLTEFFFDEPCDCRE